MRASNFDNVLELIGLGVQCSIQRFQGGNEVLGDLHDSGNVHHSGERVIRRLRHVDMVIGVNGVLGAQLATQKGDGAVGDDFINIHVELGA